MKFFSDCSGECCVCQNSSPCVAGHGDDEYQLASKEKIIDNLDSGYYPGYVDTMIETLKKVYGVAYDKNDFGKNKRN